MAGWRALLFAVVAYLLVVSIVTWNALGAPPDSVVGDTQARDLDGALWLHWWMGEILSGGVEQPWVTTHLDWPVRRPIFFRYFYFAIPLMSLPFQALWGFPDYVAPFYAAILLANLLAGMLLVRSRGVSWIVSWIGGLGFGLCPIALQDLQWGRPDNVALFPVALAFAGILKTLDTHRPMHRVLAALGIGMAFACYWYNGLFVAGAAGVLTVGLCIRGRTARPLVDLAWMLGGALLLVVPQTWPLLARVMSGTPVPGLDLGQAIGAATVDGGPVGFEISPTALFDWKYISPLMLFGALVPFVWRRPRWAPILLICGSVLLSLGESLEIGTLTIPLPLAWIRQHVPFMFRMTYPNRFLVIATTISALLVCEHLDVLLGYLRKRTKSAAVVAVLCTATVVMLADVLRSEFLPLRPQPMPISSFYRDLDASTPGAMAYVPDWKCGPREALQATHGRPLLYKRSRIERGVSLDDERKTELAGNSFMRFIWRLSRGRSLPLVDTQDLASLVDEGLRYLVMDRQALACQAQPEHGWGDESLDRDWIEQELTALLGPPIHTDDLVTVFDLAAVGASRSPW